MGRRIKAEMDDIREAIYKAVREDHPMTVRQVFYRLTVLGVIPQTENQYKNTVCRLLADMRRDGTIPYGWIAGNTRWVRRARSYGSMEDALFLTAQTYRRGLWSSADVRVKYGWRKRLWPAC